MAAGPTEKPPARCSWRRQLLFARAPGTCCTIFLAAKCQCQIPLPVLPPKAVKADIAQLIGDILPVGYPKPEVNKDGEHLHIWKRGRRWRTVPQEANSFLPARSAAFRAVNVSRYTICYLLPRRVAIARTLGFLVFDLELALGEPDGAGR